MTVSQEDPVHLTVTRVHNTWARTTVRVQGMLDVGSQIGIVVAGGTCHDSRVTTRLIL